MTLFFKRTCFFLGLMLLTSVLKAQYVTIPDQYFRTEGIKTEKESNTVSFQISDSSTLVGSNNSPLGGLPTCFFNSTLASKTNVSCHGESTGAYVITYEGKAPFRYSGIGVGNDPTIPGTLSMSSLRAGWYSIAIWDADGCYSSQYFTITEPPVLTIDLASSDYDGVSVSCNGASDGEITATVTGGVLPYSYSWSNEIHEENVSSTTSVISNLAEGFYACVLSDANGCSANANITLTEGVCSLATLTTDEVIVTRSTAVTLGGNVSIDGGSLVAERGVVWATTSDATVLNNKIEMGAGTGLFSETVADLPSETLIFCRSYAINFMGVAYGNEVSFRTKAPNNAPVDIILSTSSVDENIEVNSTVGTLSTTDVDEEDSFTYNLVGGEGDEDNALFNIIENELKISVSPDFETKSSYTVRLSTTDFEGLVYEKAFLVSVNDVFELSTSIHENQNSFDFEIFPNPTVDFVKLKVENKKKLTYKLYNMNQKLLETDTIQGGEAIIDFNKYNPSTYFLMVIDDANTARTVKVVKY